MTKGDLKMELELRARKLLETLAMMPSFSAAEEVVMATFEEIFLLGAGEGFKVREGIEK